MSIPRDPYLLIAKNADDRTLLNMLSVDKKMNKLSNSFIEGIMKERYPLLIRYRWHEESWRQFYVRMIYYISLIQEEFGIPYIPHPSFDPSQYYRSLKSYFDFSINKGVSFAALTGDIPLVDLLLSKDPGKTLANINIGLRSAASSGKKDMLIHLIRKGADDFDNALYNASEQGHDDIVKYLIETHRDNLNMSYVNHSLETAAGEGHKSTVIILLNNGATDIEDAIQRADRAGHTEIVETLNNRRNLGM